MINLVDRSIVLNNVNSNALVMEYYYAADVDRDGEVSRNDYLQIQSYLNGKIDFEADYK